MKKALKIVAVVLASVILTVVLALLGFKAFDAIKYNDFYRDAQKEFKIPGLSDGYIPQGFDYLEGEDVFLACGYMNDHSASRAYVIDRDGKSHYTALKDTDGNDYTGHAGGITSFGNFVYIAGSRGLDVFLLEDILDEDTDSAKQQATVETFDVKPAFCFIHNGEIFAGSFYREESHMTDEKFHFDTKDGKNRAMLLSFKLDATAQYGIDDSLPTAAYSLPDKVQGIAVTEDGKMILSTSYGMAASKLYIYDFDKIKDNLLNLSSEDKSPSNELFGAELPLYVLDSSALEETVTAPPMAEEIVWLDGRLWIMNESACNKYIFGKFTTGKHLWSVNLGE